MNAIQASHTLTMLAYTCMVIMFLMLVASLIILVIVIKYRHGIATVWYMIQNEEKSYKLRDSMTSKK